MINKQLNKSFYTSVYKNELHSSAGEPAFGESIVECEIYRYTSASNLDLKKGYYVLAKQRIIIPNNNTPSLGAVSVQNYNNYPAILNNKITLDVNNNAKVKIHDLFPKTLNSNVNISSSSHDGDSRTQIQQHTSGSSTNNINTFGVNVGGGMMLGMPMFNIGLSYSHTWGHSYNKQNSSGSNTTHQSDSNFGNSMSVKDWSSYSKLGNNNKEVSWVWGQTYPWDVLNYNYAQESNDINLPQFIQNRMLTSNSVLPPSELSLYGLDFTTQASWFVEFEGDIVEDEILSLSHEIECYTASHGLLSSRVSASLDNSSQAKTCNFSSKPLNMSRYSLAPVDVYNADGASIVFKNDEFTYRPETEADNFKIMSANNELEVCGSGFMETMKSSLKNNAKIEIYFKVDNNISNYDLFIMHWLKDNKTPCNINWTINDKYKGSSVVNAISDLNGEDNMTKISLRNNNYSLLNSFDYLVMGLNKIELEIVPQDIPMDTVPRDLSINLGSGDDADADAGNTVVVSDINADVIPSCEYTISSITIR